VAEFNEVAAATLANAKHLFQRQTDCSQIFVGLADETSTTEISSVVNAHRLNRKVVRTGGPIIASGCGAPVDFGAAIAE